MRNNNRLLIILIIGFVSINFGFVGASGDHAETFAQAEEIIIDKIPCGELTDDQLEILGDYYMEQMHPGELHEVMDEKIGGEGSESLRQVHINMGKAFYCGEHGAMSGGMMDTMMGRGDMMGGGSFRMMSGYYGGANYGFIWVFWILVIIALVLLIIWLTKQMQKPVNRKKR
jgi:uncharacterized membrane protein